MQTQHTPPKRRVQFNFSTPPKDHSDHSTLNVRSNLKSSRKSTTKSIRSFSPTKTPYKSLRKSDSDSDNSDSDTGRLQKDFCFQKMLGKGNFSRVSLYKSRMSSQPFAVKEMTMAKMSANELQALATISVLGDNNQNLLKYFNSWRQGSSCYITMEYCDRSLDDEYEYYRETRQKIPEEILMGWFKQALSGLNYLHNNNIVHLDIKPENILFHNECLKISDLGLCRLGRVNKWMELVEGDARYLDKIILNYHEGIDLCKADIFSMGMTFFEGVTLERLPSNGEQWHELRGGNSIIERMIDPNPENRPTAKEVLNQLQQESAVLERSTKKSRITERLFGERHDDISLMRGFMEVENYIPMEVEEVGGGVTMEEEMEDITKFQIVDETEISMHYDEEKKLGEPFHLMRRISRTPMMNQYKTKDSRERDNSL